MDPAGAPDSRLVALCRDGDERAWAEFVGRFSRYVYAIARAHRLPESDAEDVFQEAFARAYERLGELRDDAAVRAWLAQLTRRLAIDRLRGAAAESLMEEPPAKAELDASIDRVDEAMEVHLALARLSDDCREILDRFFARDESYRTIGDELSIPAGTIASRISRCLAKLRAHLEGRSKDSEPSSV